MNEFDRLCEAAVLDMILGVLPKDIPSRRELHIQNQKLQRMIAQRDKNSIHAALAILGGPASVEKAQRAKEKRAQEISQQAKKVRVLLTSYLKDFMRRDNPSLTNAEFQTWKKKFAEGTKESAKRFKAHVLKLPQKATPKRTGFGLINRSN